MFRNIFVVIILFVLYEGFFLLPEKMIVIPGVFRMSDAFFFISAIVLVLFITNVTNSFFKYDSESHLVVAFCIMTLVGILMATIFFEQSYLQGLSNFRHNFNWIAFFMFVALIRNIDGADKLLKLLTALSAVYVCILLLTKFYPTLGIIQFTNAYYDKAGTMQRFGDYRLFFPYGGMFIFMYCIALARFLYPGAGRDNSVWKQAVRAGFCTLIMYAVTSTYTRILVVSVLVVTAFAFITCKNRMLRNVTIVFTFLIISVQSLAMAIGEGVSVIEDSKLGMMAFNAGKLEKEEGRRLQYDMYLRSFLKSPLTGTGNFATGKSDYERNPHLRAYKKYGFFNAVDLGYPKVLGEHGLLGLCLVIWFFAYVYRQARRTLAKAVKLGNQPVAESIARGHIYFIIYLAVSGVTLAHFVSPDVITLLALSLAILAVTRFEIAQQSSEGSRHSI